MTTKPKTPPGLQAGGRRLWCEVLDAYDLGEHERAVLLEACRTVDALQALEDIVTLEGVTNVSPQGVRAHPALVEARQQRVTLAKLVASLRIPVEDDSGRIPQQRVGVRPASASVAR